MESLLAGLLKVYNYISADLHSIDIKSIYCLQCSLRHTNRTKKIIIKHN